MDEHRLLAFIVVSTVLIITPGVDMALVTRNALRHGRQAALYTAIGIGAGIVIWAIAAVLGIVGVLSTSAIAFTALKLLGAGYLLFLGLQTLWHSFRGDAGAGHVAPARVAAPTVLPPLPAGRAFRQGILSNLLNPKIAIFFTSFLPQFIDPADSVPLQTLALGGIFIVLGFIWLPCFALIASQAAAILRRPRIKALLDRLTAVVLIAFGVRLATERR